MGMRFFPPRKAHLYALVAGILVTNFGTADTGNANAKEALTLRRITEYWKDGDYATVKRQIIDFLEKNPKTTLHDHLHAMLGDLYFQERNFRQALATYDTIGNPEIRGKTFFNHLQAHFEMRDFLEVVRKGEEYIRDHKGNALEVKVRYLVAEAAFRHALKCGDLDEKIFYLKQAKPHYKLLTQTKYSDRALFPLAEIHRLLREDARAAALYLHLADKYPDHRERFLFQAAILQINDNRQQAIESFKKVHELGGKRSRLAAFNQLILLYQDENYEEFLELYDKVIAKMPDQKVPLLQFYEGRCHYAMGDYSQAAFPLENYITATKGKSKELKTAHLLLVNCSRYLKDLSLLERTLYSFKTAFPKDSEVPKVLMIHAQMCRESGNFQQALNDMQMLASEYPGYEDREAVLYDHALLLSQADRWSESQEMFLNFLEAYPQSQRKNAAWRHLLNCCIEQIQSPSQMNSEKTKSTFVSILEEALKEEGVLSVKEKEQYLLVKLKCQCELEQYETVAHALTQYLTDVVDEKQLAEAHLLMAICQQKLDSDFDLFIQHAESALAYNPTLPDKGLLHLELYNAYLSKGLSSDDGGNTQYFMGRAAENLYASGAWKTRTIKLDNFLWLANHFYQQARQGSKEGFTKAQCLFKELLGIENDEDQLNIASDSLFLEAEVLKYAHLLSLAHRPTEQVVLLEKLVRKQEEHAHLPWKLKKRAVFELARAYEADDQYQNALNSYRYLTQAEEGLSSMVKMSAQLHLAKLQYRLLPQGQRQSESPEVTSILHTLKDLQIQKKVPSEPLHLEAALQYAEIRTALSPLDDFEKNAIFFYKRIREDFHNENDPIAIEYTTQRENCPEKNRVFGTYMNYIEAQLLKASAQLARKEKQGDKAIELEDRAMQILDDLLSNEEVLKPYLSDRVKRAKVELTKQL